MFVIWRGFGWTIPIIVFASFLLTQSILDSTYGEAYYRSNDWPKTAAIIAGSLIIGLLGYFLNYKKRNVVIDEETGKKNKSPSHTLFFIPIEFWAVLIPLLFLWMEQYGAEQDALDITYIQSPIVNDKYLVDYTKIFDGADEEYKYGVMKISSVSAETVELLISEMSYDGKSGPKKDIREAKTSDRSYFVQEPAIFTRTELLNLKNIDAIDSVVRD